MKAQIAFADKHLGDLALLVPGLAAHETDEVRLGHFGKQRSRRGRTERSDQLVGSDLANLETGHDLFVVYKKIFK